MPIHVRAHDCAPFVLLSGDPDRTRWIAENVLQDAVLTTDYRHMFGYNGTYDDMPISVYTTGMGGPSAAIVCEELASIGARFFVRVGTCGTMDGRMNPGDLLLVTAACMADGTSKELIRSRMAHTHLDLGFAATADFDFLYAARLAAADLGITGFTGKVASLDRFYGHSDETYKELHRLGIAAVEMETATVFTEAALHGLRAAALMTVSDQVFGAKRASEDDIQAGVVKMVKTAVLAAKTMNL